MWHKAKWKGHPMRLELTRVGLLAELANHYITRGAFYHPQWKAKRLLINKCLVLSFVIPLRTLFVVAFWMVCSLSASYATKTFVPNIVSHFFFNLIWILSNASVNAGWRKTNSIGKFSQCNVWLALGNYFLLKPLPIISQQTCMWAPQRLCLCRNSLTTNSEFNILAFNTATQIESNISVLKLYLPRKKKKK